MKVIKRRKDGELIKVCTPCMESEVANDMANEFELPPGGMQWTLQNVYTCALCKGDAQKDAGMKGMNE